MKGPIRYARPLRDLEDLLVELCNGCGRCAEVCVYEAMRVEKKGSGLGAGKARVVSEEKCIGCALCVSGGCPPGRLRVQSRRL